MPALIGTPKLPLWNSPSGALPFWPSENNTIGPSPVAGSSSGSLFLLLGGRPIKRSGTFTRCLLQAGASATVKIKHFRRDGFTFTMLSEQSVSVVAGLNTFDSSLGTLTPVAVTAGDYFGLFSADGSWIQYNIVTAPSGTEYYSNGTDVTTTLAVSPSALPANTIQLQVQFTVSVPSAAGVASVGKVIYLGPKTPAAGSVPNLDTAETWFEDHIWPVQSRLETLEAHSTVAAWALVEVLAPTVSGFTQSRIFSLDLLSGHNNYVAGTDFPIDVLVPAGGMIGVWPMMSGLSSDAFNARQYRPLDASSPGGAYPSSTTNAFTADAGSQSAQIRFGLRRTASIPQSTTRVDQTFSVIPVDFSATNWSVVGGKARNSANGLANAVIYRRGGDYAGKVSAWVTFSGASDEIAVFRSPRSPGDGSAGTIVTVTRGTNVIAIRALWNGSSVLPAVATSKTSTLTFAASNPYRIDLERVGTNLTVTVTDTIGLGVDTLTFTGKDGAGNTSAADGWCYGQPGFAATVGTIDVSRLLFTTAISTPSIMIFGDSWPEGTGATADATAWSYKIVAALGGNGLVSAVGGSGSGSVLGRIEYELRQFYPRDVLVQIGGNDSGSSATVWQNNITEIAKRVTDCGANLWFGAVGAEVANLNREQVMNPWLRTNYPGQVIGFDKALTNGGTGLSADRNASLYYDTLHPNDAGHAAMFAQVKADAPQIFA